MAIQSKLASLTPAAERLKKTVTLISRGYSLRPEVTDGQLTVYPWDLEISEWVMQTAEQNGNAFSAAVVQKLTRLPAKLMSRFVASELLTVMLIARSLTTDGAVEYRAKCPFCKTVQKLTRLQVPGEMQLLGTKAVDYPGYDVITLPVSQDVIKLRPLLVGDLDAIAEQRPPAISETGANLAASILEVNDGKPDKLAELFEYYLALPPKDVEFLRKSSLDLSPALATVVPHVCDNPKCELDFNYNLGLNYDFFLSSLQD